MWRLFIIGYYTFLPEFLRISEQLGATGNVRSENVSHYRLWKALFTEYNPEIRPVTDPRIVTNISFETQLFEILSINDAENSIKISGHLELTWKDHFIVWNPDDYHGIKEIFVPPKSIWTPEISVEYNLAVVMPTLDAIDLRVRSDGSVTQYLPFITYSVCYINAKKFPFDEQKCNIEFSSWAHSLTTIDYSPISQTVDLTEYVISPDWDLISATQKRDTKVYEDDDGSIILWPEIFLKLKVRREPFYYIFNIVMPSTIITGTSKPGVRKAKFKLGITTLLSMSILLLTVTNYTPKFSTTPQGTKKGTFSQVPLIAIFYTALLIITAVSTLSASVPVLFERNGAMGRLMPQWLRYLCFIFNDKVARNKLAFSEDYDNSLRKAALKQTGLTNYIQLVRIITEVNLRIKDLKHFLVAAHNQTHEKNEWTVLADIYNFCSLVFFLSLIALTLLLFFFHEWY